VQTSDATAPDATASDATASCVPASDAAGAGRFTRSDGVRGWVQAKRRRSAFYGPGKISVDSDAVVVNGWRRTWLGVGYPAEYRIPLEQVRNVTLEKAHLEFEWKKPYRLTHRLQFDLESATAASAVAEKLPDTKTQGFQKNWGEIREFNARLRALGTRVRVTPALVAVNLLVYLGLVIVSRRLGGFDVPLLLKWGANFGPFAVNGQWWRIVTALFLHLNLAHVLLNMWALWNVGRLTERLYGSWTFACLYFASGVLANLASIAWDPSHTSVGASGAIFGIFGAFLAFLARPSQSVPRRIVRAHWISTLAFVAFSLINGFMQTGIDNAAHVGGVIAGFVLGWMLVRPLSVEHRRAFPFRQTLAAIAATSATIFLAAWHVVGFGAQLTPPEQYFRDHAWFLSGETANVRRWQQLAVQASTGAISEAELGRQFDADIVPFWKSADSRLKDERERVPTDQAAIAAEFAALTALRLQWSSAIVDATKNRRPDAIQDVTRLMTETDRAEARIERLSILASMAHRPRALAESSPAVYIRDFFSGGRAKCIRPPTVFGRYVGPTDNPADGPAQRDTAACLAQRLLGSRRYAALDSQMTQAAASLGDLMDGGSTFAGIVAGLDDYVEFGRFDVQQLLGRTADWRRAVPKSVYPDLIEALIFENWAWAVRGFGNSNEVSPQAWVVFAHRTEMAAASLDAAARAADETPLWYQLSLDIGLDKSKDVKTLRAIADEGMTKYPRYSPLSQRMLRILMPRWLGSYRKIDEFIADLSVKGSQFDDEKYAMLYWEYDSLENDDVNIFKEALAEWLRMKLGFRGLTDRYPNSDVILNAFARFACISGDSKEYRRLKPNLENRLSATVWTEKISIEKCDQKFAASED
jgi:membrane associated rhomboid family serine protease